MDTVLNLQFLNDEYAVFAGQSTEEQEVRNFLGTTENIEHKYPSLMLSLEMWETLGKPTSVRAKFDGIFANLEL